MRRRRQAALTKSVLPVFVGFRFPPKALETVLADPDRYASEYVTAQQGGITWKHRTQGRIPTELADKLPGSHRQSASMMASIALSTYLEKAAHELTM